MELVKPTATMRPAPCRQCRLVGKYSFASFNLAEGVVRKDLKFEPELAHPPRHDTAVDFDMIAQEDRFLPIKRQAVAVFGDRDIGEQRFRWNAAFNDMCRRHGLNDTVFVFEGVLRTMGDDHPELRRDDIQPP